MIQNHEHIAESQKVEKMRKEICEISEGEGVFDLRGDWGGNILYYKQKPYAYEWFDNLGSLCKYVIRSISKIEINQYLQDIRYYAENGMHDDVKLVYAIDPLLKLLTRGTYELNYPFNSIDGFALNLVEFENQELIDIYPLSLTLICLQPLRSLDSARIEYFKEKIKKGATPVIFALGFSEARNKYILDGHHKAYAYMELNVEPTILFIKKQDDMMELSEERKAEALNHILPDGNISKDKHPIARGKKD